LRVAAQPRTEQRNVSPRWIEQVAPIPEIERCHPAQAQGGLPEDVHIDLWDIPAPLQPREAAEIGRSRVLVEGSVDEIAAARRTQIGKPARRGPCHRPAQWI